MNGIRNTYLYVCGSQRLLNIRRIYTSAGLIGLNVDLNVIVNSCFAAQCRFLLTAVYVVSRATW